MATCRCHESRTRTAWPARLVVAANRLLTEKDPGQQAELEPLTPTACGHQVKTDTPTDRSTAQLDSTPNSPRCESMKATTSCVGGRLHPEGAGHRFTFVGRPEFSDLPLEIRDALYRLARGTWPAPHRSFQLGPRISRSTQWLQHEASAHRVHQLDWHRRPRTLVARRGDARYQEDSPPEAREAAAHLELPERQPH